MGPFISLPWGFALLTLIGCIVMIVIGVIGWKVMWHEPDDYVDIDKQEPFVFKD